MGNGPLLSDLEDIGPNITLSDLLKRFSPSDADMQSARGHALMMAGLGILANANRPPAMAVGQGGLLGLNSYNDEIKQLQGQGMRNMAGASAALDVQNKLQNMQDIQGVRRIVRGMAPVVPPTAQPAAPSDMGPPSPPTAQAPAPAQPAMTPNFTPAQQAAIQADALKDGRPASMTARAPDGSLGNMPVFPQQQSAPPSAPQAPQQNIPMVSGPLVQKRAMADQYLKYSQALSDQGYVAPSQQYFEMAQKILPKAAGTETLMMGGKPVTIQKYEDGSIEVLNGFDPTPKVHWADTGNAIRPINELNNQQLGPALPKTVTPGEAASNQLGWANNAIANERLNVEKVNADPLGMLGLNKNGPAAQMGGGSGPVAISGDTHGDDLLKTMPQPIADQVKALAEGRMAFPAGFALKSPYWQTMISLVSAYDPSFDAVNYNARNKVRQDFTSGKSAENLKALNTAMAHLDSLNTAMSSLNNFGGVLTPLNAPTNYVESTLGDPRQKDVQLKTEAVSNELAKVFRSSGMSQSDIGRWQDTISPNMSPAQQKAVVQGALDLMNGRIQALGDTYSKGLGTTGDGLQLLSPKAQQTYQKLSGQAPTTAAATTASNQVTLPNGKVMEFPSEAAANAFRKQAGL